MNLDENAAAFGLFHLVYANLYQRLASTVHCMRQISEPNLRFEEVFSESFSRLSKRLNKELKQFNNESPCAQGHQNLVGAPMPVAFRIVALPGEHWMQSVHAKRIIQLLAPEMDRCGVSGAHC